MPDPITIEFEYTDDTAAQAVRENWFVLGRRSFSPSTIALIAASTAIFVVAVRSRTSLQWLILSGAAPALLLLMLIIWVIGLWWAPRAAQKKLARLAHRNVTIQLGEEALTITTANERLEVKWIEVRELRELPHFLVLVLATNSEIPMPKKAVNPEAREWLDHKLARQPPKEPAEETSEAPPEKTVEEAVEPTPEESPEVTAEQTPEPTPAQAAEQISNQTPEKKPDE